MKFNFLFLALIIFLVPINSNCADNKKNKLNNLINNYSSNIIEYFFTVDDFELAKIKNPAWIEVSLIL